MRRLTALALVVLATPLVAQQGGRPPVPMDSARARALYVSNRHEDHPVANYDQAIARKKVIDSVYEARSKGVMNFTKTTYRSRYNDLDIPVYVFTPLRMRGPRGHAAMVWVHGGVHGMWDNQYLPFVIEAVQRGYVIVAPDYRGSTGYGETHHRAIDYGGKELDDVEDAIGFLQRIPEVDPTRIGIMGWSHGGFIASHLVMRGAQSKFVAAAAIVPVTNLVFRLSYKGPQYARSFSTQKEMRGLPHENRAEYIKRSPYYRIDSLARPILVHVATNDTDVDFVEDQMMIDGLRSRKPELSETKIYVDPTPGPASGGHTFSRKVTEGTWVRDDSPAQVDSWNLTWAFFEKHLRLSR
jgi:dipeptidyl aminopeptidase/acylaminoacyl peptidase